MAAPNLRVVRRPKGALTASAAPSVLTAASAPVTDVASIFKTAGIGGRSLDWQAEAWEHYRSVGEFGAYVRWRANCCSRVLLVASEINDKGEPTGAIDEESAEGRQVAQFVRDIAGGAVGQSEIIQRTAQILCVPGELWTAVLQRPEGERWYAVTRREMVPGDRPDTLMIKLPDGTKHEFNQDNGDGLFRVWDADAEDATQPTSPARANLDPLREIRQASAKIRNADLSRLIGNGILAIPAEASLPSAGAPVSADKPAGSPAAPTGPSDVGRDLTQLIVQQAEIAIQQGPTSTASLVPIVIKMPSDQVDKIKHIEFADQITPVALQTRNDGISRLAMGLDMSPEQMLGLGSNSNHWSSFILADQDVQLYVAPLMKLICRAYYDNALRNVLIAAGIDPNKYTLWYDTSRLTADPDLTDETEAAWQAGLITSKEYLRLKGLPADALRDLTTIEGYQELARDKVAAADPASMAQVMRDLMPLLDPAVQSISLPEPTQALPPGGATNDPATEEPSGAEQGQEPNTEEQNTSKQSAAIDSGISMAMDLMITRALELAGKRRVRGHDPEQAQRLRHVEPHDYHRVMAPASAAQVPKLIKGWDAGLDELAARYGFDPNHVRSVVERRAREQLTAQVVDA